MLSRVVQSQLIPGSHGLRGNSYATQSVSC